jgi:uncharacterized MnhB-related membrane protein
VTVLQLVALAAVAFTGTATVLVREPLRQLIVAGFFGLALAVLFFVFGAPDVALSELTVGSLVLPVMVLLTLGRLRRDEEGG